MAENTTTTGPKRRGRKKGAKKDVPTKRAYTKRAANGTSGIPAPGVYLAKVESNATGFTITYTAIPGMN